jgi:hypothetical protein
MAYGWNYGGDDWDNFNWGETPANTSTPSEQQYGVDTGVSTPTTPEVKSTSTSTSNSSSTSKMPTWWTDSTKDWLYNKQRGKTFNWMDDIYKQYFQNGPAYKSQIDEGVNRASDFWHTYQQMPEQIEQKRKSMIDQIYANLPQMRELYQPTMEGMSRRGILNSSVTGSALGDIQEGVNREIMGKVADTNTWAADKNISVTENTPDVIAKLQSIIQDASTQRGQYAKDSSSFTSNYQSLINQLYEMLKETTSTSKTYV